MHILFLGIFIFTIFVSSNGLATGQDPSAKQGQFSIFGSDIKWKDAEGVFEIVGINSEESIKLKFPTGKEKSFPVAPVKKLDGSYWDAVALYNQIQINTQSATKVLASKPAENSKTLRLDPNDVQSWFAINDIPIPVRTQLREPLKAFTRTHFSFSKLDGGSSGE